MDTLSLEIALGDKGPGETVAVPAEELRRLLRLEMPIDPPKSETATVRLEDLKRLLVFSRNCHSGCNTTLPGCRCDDRIKEMMRVAKCL